MGNVHWLSDLNVIAALVSACVRLSDQSYVREISLISTSSYDHLLKSFIEPASAATSFGKTPVD